MATDSTNTEPDLPAGVPVENIEVYARLFQLENWLREMVYLELKAGYGEKWETEYEKRVGNKKRRAEGAKDRDKTLSHMRTREQRLLAYADLGDLFAVVLDADKQAIDNAFAPFFPPARVLAGKLAEVIPIRLRTMHCRSLHPDDRARLLQFLRDMDQGFWLWCTSYNSPRIANIEEIEDTIGKRFRERDARPFVRWADGSTRISSARQHDEPVSLQVGYSVRPGWKTDNWDREPLGSAGWLYHVTLYGNPPRERWVDVQEFLRGIKSLLEKCVYVHVGDQIEISLPKLDDPVTTAEYIEAFVRVAQSCAFRIGPSERRTDDYYSAVLRSYPEIVLGPRHPLSFLTADMPCSWFGLDVQVDVPGRFLF